MVIVSSVACGREGAEGNFSVSERFLMSQPAQVGPHRCTCCPEGVLATTGYELSHSNTCQQVREHASRDPPVLVIPCYSIQH